MTVPHVIFEDTKHTDAIFTRYLFLNGHGTTRCCKQRLSPEIDSLDSYVKIKQGT
jgi:hypothetical protein